MPRKCSQPSTRPEAPAPTGNPSGSPTGNQADTPTGSPSGDVVGSPAGSRPFAPLPRSFFLPAPDVVARALLGKLLLRRRHGLRLTGRIVETEAYFGADDAAAHAASGRTARNAVLWGEPGHAYVYFIYGMHSCLNVSCEPLGSAGCVLVRALEPLDGLPHMAALRGLPPGAVPRLLTGGPGRLCQALDITRAGINGLDLLDPSADLQLADDGWQPGAIEVTPRIGIRKAAERPLRFLVAGSPCVSGPRRPPPPSAVTFNGKP